MALLELRLTLPKTKEEAWHFIRLLDRQKRESLVFSERTEAYVGSLLSEISEKDGEQYGQSMKSELQESVSDHMESVSVWRTFDAYVQSISEDSIGQAASREEVLRHVKANLDFHVAHLEREVESSKRSLEEMQAEFSRMEPSEDDYDNGRFDLWDAIDVATEDFNRMQLVLPVCWLALKEFVETEGAQWLFTSAELDFINSDDRNGYRALILSR